MVRGPLPAAPRAAPTKPAAAGGHRHTVVKGDTLFSLAQRYYGSRAKWRQLLDANRDVLSGPDALRLGQELKIP